MRKWNTTEDDMRKRKQTHGKGKLRNKWDKDINMRWTQINKTYTILENNK